MKLIHLLRHAKSSWDDPDIDDFERPLNKRGHKTAVLLADYFRRQRIRPDIVLCSPAKRTRQTLDALRASFHDVPVTCDRRLYDAAPMTLHALLAELPRRCLSVLLIGHNPGLQQLALALSDPGRENPERPRLAEKFPTGGLVSLSAPIEEWPLLKDGTCTLEAFIRPRDLDPAE
ncbi:SixA phosphatase family protein [Telmatospirillum siberiense]|nr:histidine phosphatase family protein [Telmatospirillum siberiense]